MRYLLFLVCFSLFSMEESPPNKGFSITVRGSREQEDAIVKALTYFLGNVSPHTAQAVAPKLRDKIRSSPVRDDDLFSIAEHLNKEQPLSDSQDVDIRMRALKSMITTCIEESLQEREEVAADAQLQLKLRDKDLKSERYKLYGALIALGGTALTSVSAIVALVLS